MSYGNEAGIRFGYLSFLARRAKNPEVRAEAIAKLRELGTGI